MALRISGVNSGLDTDSIVPSRISIKKHRPSFPGNRMPGKK